ncbi:MAG: TIGR04282 family arsenosugar biosynthesis glycosyltransferase [Verrucomicrobiota bacterium]
MQQASVIIFLKAPFAGLVKTRLARSLGDEQALKVYKALAAGQIERIGNRLPLEVHFAPENAADAMLDWLGPQHSLYPQCEGDLGNRLISSIQSTYERHKGPVICIGGDCPGLNQAHLLQAAAALDTGSDLVLGPSEDGGYYLIGFRKPTPELLQDIPWSTAETLKATMQRAQELGLSTHKLETLYDVDELPEFERAQRDGLVI